MKPSGKIRLKEILKNIINNGETDKLLIEKKHNLKSIGN